MTSPQVPMAAPAALRSCYQTSDTEQSLTNLQMLNARTYQDPTTQCPHTIATIKSPFWILVNGVIARSRSTFGATRTRHE